jgi:hypothetical protein
MGKESVSDPDSNSSILNLGAEPIIRLRLGLGLGLSVSIMGIGIGSRFFSL